jgi:hypothetical protein
VCRLRGQNVKRRRVRRLGAEGVVQGILQQLDGGGGFGEGRVGGGEVREVEVGYGLLGLGLWWRAGATWW